MRLKKYNKSIGMLSLIVATVMLSGCDMVLMDPKGAIGVEQRRLILTAIGLMLIVVVPVIHGICLCLEVSCFQQERQVQSELVTLQQY